MKACCAPRFSMTTHGRTGGPPSRSWRAPTRRATPILLRAMGRGSKAAKTRAIAFGFQVVLGTLVNAILNDPGPLSIHDRELKERLSNLLQQLLEAEMS